MSDKPAVLTKKQMLELTGKAKEYYKKELEFIHAEIWRLSGGRK